MRRILPLLLFLTLAFCVIDIYAQNSAEVVYDKYFTHERARIGLVFAGDASDQQLYLAGLYMEPLWSGPRKTLVEPFDYGEYRYEIYSKDGELLMRKGFNTLFQEWRTTPEAQKTKRAFTGSYTIPFPKDTIKVIFFQRSRVDGKYSSLLTLDISPEDKSINRDIQNSHKALPVLVNGDFGNKVDLLFIAEGYSVDQMDKFLFDAKKFTSYLFEKEPYKSRQEDFNIWALCIPSEESGTDIPQNNIWKNTALSSNFYTFSIDRYLTAPDHSRIATAAWASPYDIMYVIVNTDKYGGGGIYNFYGLSMSDHKNEGEVFVHEFGHAFAGLADEYYTSVVTYEEFYNLSLEPWEPNITTKVDFASKWLNLMGKDSVGLYEGGGYTAKGIFRPREDCKMKSNASPTFCPVCERAINKMIDFYTK